MPNREPSPDTPRLSKRQRFWYSAIPSALLMVAVPLLLWWELGFEPWMIAAGVLMGLLTFGNTLWRLSAESRRTERRSRRRS